MRLNRIQIILLATALLTGLASLGVSIFELGRDNPVPQRVPGCEPGWNVIPHPELFLGEKQVPWGPAVGAEITQGTLNDYVPLVLPDTVERWPGLMSRFNKVMLATDPTQDTVVTGLAFGKQGNQVTIINMSASNRLYITDHDARSIAANRFVMSWGISLNERDTMTFQYEACESESM